jgi:NAD(P)-dependent dehydrogenase (short-subunit alcohol dehydrogenase family)
MKIGSKPSLSGKRVLITGAARGIGAALAWRLHERGARVAVVGLEPEKLEDVARSCGDGPWAICDVANRAQVDSVVLSTVEALGGLDVVVANAGIATQLPLIGGEPEMMDRIIKVNLLGVYNTLRAAGPHISHGSGYALVMSSLAAAVQLPMMGAYSASKAGVEALGNTLRVELRPSGAKVGVAYFASLDTDMTRRGFGTEAARALPATKRFVRITPLEVGIDAVERGIARRARRVVVPRWTAPALTFRLIAQAVADRVTQPRLAKVLEIARTENAPLTTTQPEEPDE